jgi:biotin operon repressor
MTELKDVTKMNKAELLDEIERLNVHYAERVTDLEMKIQELEDRLSRKRTDGRKEEVLALLQTKPMSILEMSEALDISNKNISSQLCYLKKDGHRIATNADGQKHLEGFDYSEIEIPEEIEAAEETIEDNPADESAE